MRSVSQDDLHLSSAGRDRAPANAATPMTAWGETVAPRYIRFIFSREPVERIALLRERLNLALAELT